MQSIATFFYEHSYFVKFRLHEIFRENAATVESNAKPLAILCIIQEQFEALLMLHKTAAVFL